MAEKKYPAEVPDLRQEEQIAKLLDSAFRLPGTQIRFGWDALVGLLPAGGDLAGLLPSLWLIWRLRKKGIPNDVALDMLLYALADMVVGTIPLAGDILDIGMKANERNLKRAKKYFEENT